MRKLLITLCVITLTACAAFSPAAPAPAGTSNPTPTSNLPPSASPTSGARYLVLISLDACRPEYLDLAPLPNLKSLMDSGVAYTDAWVGALVSNTPPGHTEMSTGTLPNHNGILSFSWTDSDTGQRIDPTTLEAINNGEMARIVQQSGVPTIAGLVKAQTPEARVVAVSSQKFYAAQGLGMGPTDYIVYSTRPAKAQSKGKQTPTPEAERGVEGSEQALSAAALKGREPPAGVLNDPRLHVEVKNPGDENTFAINAALVLFEKYKPRALLINLPATDEYGHQTGGIIAPDTMRQVMLTTDEGIGKLIAAYKAAGIFDQTLWVITADHGMIPNTHEIDPQALRKVARDAGNKKGNVQVPYGHLGNPSNAMTLAEAVAKSGIPGIVGTYAKVKVSGHYEYQPAPTTKAALSPALNDAYLYLLDSFVGSTSPDLVTMTAENTLVGNEKKPGKHGSHGEVTWGDQHIPLILSGPGIRRGATSSAPARLVDILPTIARVMGWPTTGMDGIVLADALANPQAADVSAQKANTEKVAPLRDALKASK